MEEMELEGYEGSIFHQSYNRLCHALIMRQRDGQKCTCRSRCKIRGNKKCYLVKVIFCNAQSHLVTIIPKFAQAAMYHLNATKVCDVRYASLCY